MEESSRGKSSSSRVGKGRKGGWRLKVGGEGEAGGGGRRRGVVCWLQEEEEEEEEEEEVEEEV